MQPPQCTVCNHRIPNNYKSIICCSERCELKSFVKEYFVLCRRFGYGESQYKDHRCEACKLPLVNTHFFTLYCNSYFFSLQNHSYHVNCLETIIESGCENCPSCDKPIDVILRTRLLSLKEKWRYLMCDYCLQPITTMHHIKLECDHLLHIQCIIHLHSKKKLKTCPSCKYMLSQNNLRDFNKMVRGDWPM